MVAKPLAVFMLAVVCLVGAACSNVATQQADRQVPPAAVEPAPASGQPTNPTSEAATSAPTSTDDDVAPVSTGDRGSRALGADDTADDNTADDVATNTAEPTAAPVSEPTVEPAPAPAQDAEPTAAPEATATAAPTSTPVPTPVPTTAPILAQPGQDPIFTAPEPTGPVPSDDIVVQGPQVDESQPVAISDSGAAACARAESAIEFLDVGDANRTAAALQEAAQFAEQASEPEIALRAGELAATGTDEAAAINAIIATLNACATYGYQV